MSYFESDGIKLYYEVYGDDSAKETVFLLNGVMASTNSWHNLLDTFKQLNMRVVLHDFMGQMRSDKPQGPYTFKQHVDQLLALSDYLNVDTFHLLGTSYGSEVAMRCAIDHPQRVLSLTLIDGVSETNDVMRAFLNSWKTLCDLEDPYDFFWGMAPSIYGNTFMKKNYDFLEKRALAMRKVDRSYFEGQKILYDTFLKEVDFTDELHHIQCPALVVVGEEDILKPVVFSRIIASHIKNSEIYIIPDCGHVTVFEKEDELKTLITGFYAKKQRS
ncbi:MAG: alpha/beta hydrolase [Erysipelothrix sp.]|nr:alpha/beta hydrolase [Erysipelothrix sp.]